MKAKSKKRNKSKNTAKHLDIDACFEIVTEDRCCVCMLVIFSLNGFEQSSLF